MTVEQDETQRVVNEVETLLGPHRLGTTKLRKIRTLIEELALSERAAGYAQAQAGKTRTRKAKAKPATGEVDLSALLGGQHEV